ncbi:MAG: helix-turn-helix domain-containing protein [Ramlibacter sp.]|nr:helix-turn-helix domain-containing protein [Ramlibacter sp.]
MQDNTVTAGALLREAREAAGLHIAALAVSLKVPVRKLEALEEDRLDQLPDAVFVRALASSVCRTLKVDPAPVLARLPQTAVPRLAHDQSGINAPFRPPNDVARPSWADQLTRPVVLAVAALLLGALVLVLLPSMQRAVKGMQPEADVALPVTSPGGAPMPAGADASSGTTVVVSPAVPAAVATPASPTVSVVASTPTVVSPTLVVNPTTTVAKAATASVPVAPAPAVAASGPVLPTTGTLVFKASGESWVEVTDAKGVVAVRKTLVAGETVGASGAMPLAVVIGRADATTVQVRGKPFDLGAVSRDNVARFEIK